MTCGGSKELNARCRAFVTVDPGLAFATVVPVKSRASIDSQFLAANCRIDIFVGKPRQGCLGAIGIYRLHFPTI